MKNPLNHVGKNIMTSVKEGSPDEKQKPHRHFSLRRLGVILFLLILLSFISTMLIIEFWPYYGAQAASQMRDMVGPQVVASLETILFQIQDAWKGWRFQFGAIKNEAPWESTSHIVKTQIPSVEPSLVPTLLKSTTSPSIVTPATGFSGQQLELGDDHLEAIPSHTPTPIPDHWQLPTLMPFGSLEGEGIWQPYLYNQDGQVVAYRTFLQPDPERPYTLVAVVAFDLNRTRLNFVLGFNEPSLPDGPRGDGLIPEIDRQPDILLAAFNGGFRAANGHFGAMAGGIIALTPKDEIATVGIYQDNEVRIGNWGEDIRDTPNLKAWRQNCRLIVQDGAISSRVYSDSITDWGASISNQIVTRRSGLGIDQNADTLYYFAGPSLSMPVLANTMLAVGVYDGMLLDINHFWVHFTAIRDIEGELVAEPLLPDDMIDHIDRYLLPSPVDFFYITALDNLNP